MTGDHQQQQQQHNEANAENQFPKSFFSESSPMLGMGHSGFHHHQMAGLASSDPTTVATEGLTHQQLQTLVQLQQQQQHHLALQQAQALLLQQQQQQQLLLQHQHPFHYPPGTVAVTHNLIPTHLQGSAEGPSLNGSPGHPSAVILPGGAVVPPGGPLPSPLLLLPTQIPPIQTQQPILTVQDRPMVQPTYNGVNPNYPGLRLVHSSPPVFVVEQFLTPYECDFLIHNASDAFERAPVVGKGVGEVSPSRTSSTCYLAREDVPDLMRKTSALTGKPIEHCELPQVGRYMPTEQYLQHFDAFDLSNEDGRRFASNGGQRVITVLVYLNDVHQGGETSFPALHLSIKPQRGMALVFFPATVDGLLDKMALHAAQPAIDVKYVSQVWIRQSIYNGQPSKRLTQTLGPPFHAAAASPTDMTGVVSMF